MKKITILFIFLLYVYTGCSYAVTFHDDKLTSNVIGVSHSAQGKKLKVIIQKGTTKYTYSLRNDGKVDYYPLQFGSGTYSVTALENVTGNQYSVLKSENIDVKVTDKNAVYLQSIQIIDYKSTDPPIKKAKSLGNNDNIYDYIVKNVK